MTSAQSPIDGPTLWRGTPSEVAAAQTRFFSSGEIDELDAALATVKARALDFPATGPAMFPLPTLGPFFRGLPERLRTGPGFLLLRGLPRARYDDDDMARLYWGIGAHLGRALPQSWQGEVLGQVIDVSDVEPDARGYHTGRPQGMHTDNCDIVGLMGLRAPRSGGISRIVSAASVHNALLAARPDLLAVLYQGFTFRRTDADARHGNGRAVKRVAIFSQASGALSCTMNGSYIRRAVSSGDAVLTAIQSEALTALRRFANAPDLAFDMEIGPGDIQFLNNRAILHGRTAYEDWPEPVRRRHLLRLWLAVPDWPALPADQGMHGADDHAGWLRQRRKLMELPSRYFAEIGRRQGSTNTPDLRR